MGPTNSGKTHAALQALKAADTGVYCGPPPSPCLGGMPLSIFWSLLRRSWKETCWAGFDLPGYLQLSGDCERASSGWAQRNC